MNIAGKYLLGLFAAAVLFLGATLPVAQAEEDEYSGSRATIGAARPSNPKWVSECGACHLAFPARFLPAESWREMMSGLDNHFGSNAVLDEETAREITVFLVDNARRKKSRDASGNMPKRITESRWFMREHARAELRVKNNPKVKSMANCAVCHIKAEQGDYSERNIKIPK